MRNNLIGSLTALVAVLLGLFSTSVGAAPDICTSSSIQLVGANPGSIDMDGTVASPTPVAVTGKVTQAAPSIGGCTNGTTGVAVEEGTLEIETSKKKIDGVPTWVHCKDPGVGPFTTLISRVLPNSTPPGTNAAVYNLDTTGLGGKTAGFRAQYKAKNPGGSYKSSASPCVDLVISEAPPGARCDAYDNVVVLSIVGGAGQGIVLPGQVGPWLYTFEVLNCTGLPNLPVKVQGGTSGWTVFDSVSTVPVEPVGVVAKSNGKKGTTSTLTWNTVLNHEQSKTITVGVDGVVPNVPMGTWLNLSGAWSAAYKNGIPLKSDYTPQVYVEVNTP